MLPLIQLSACIVGIGRTALADIAKKTDVAEIPRCIEVRHYEAVHRVVDVIISGASKRRGSAVAARHVQHHRVSRRCKVEAAEIFESLRVGKLRGHGCVVQERRRDRTRVLIVEAVHHDLARIDRLAHYLAPGGVRHTGICNRNVGLLSPLVRLRIQHDAVHAGFNTHGWGRFDIHGIAAACPPLRAVVNAYAYIVTSRQCPIYRCGPPVYGYDLAVNCVPDRRIARRLNRPVDIHRIAIGIAHISREILVVEHISGRVLRGNPVAVRRKIYRWGYRA